MGIGRSRRRAQMDEEDGTSEESSSGRDMDGDIRSLLSYLIRRLKFIPLAPPFQIHKMIVRCHSGRSTKRCYRGSEPSCVCCVYLNDTWTLNTRGLTMDRGGGGRFYFVLVLYFGCSFCHENVFVLFCSGQLRILTSTSSGADDEEDDTGFDEYFPRASRVESESIHPNVAVVGV